MAGAADPEMPDMKDELLQSAMDTLAASPFLATIPVVTIDYVGNQKQLNRTNWVVCSQYPKSGEEVPAKLKNVTLFVKRPTAKSCWA